MAYEQLKNKLIIGDVDVVDLIDQITSASILAIYPVGSIYISGDQTFDPNVSFGGTWEKIENRFLLGSGTRSVGAIGGEENVTLNINQIPSHNHGSRGSMNITGNFGYGNINKLGQYWTDGCFSATSDITTGYGGNHYNIPTINFDASRNWTGTGASAGGGQSHNNMPPYQVVSMWKRIA